MRREANRKDCFSLVKEELSHNPFMTKLLKSHDFKPEPGVSHIDNILLQNSPSVSGGAFKPPNPMLMSRADFNKRTTTLSMLKDYGPDRTRKNGRNISMLSQSIDVMNHKRLDISSGGLSFSKISADGGSRAASEMEKPLPSIKVYNKQSMNEMLASLEEI